MARKPKNYLDFVPLINPRNSWDQDDQGKVTIHMVHRGVYAWIAQKFFHRPRVSHIDLDRYGSFVWTRIDGKKTVGQLALEMREAFGPEAEPLYDRLVKYMQILYNNQFVVYRKTDRNKRG